MSDMNTKFRWIHGLVKGTISNVVMMAHKAIPKDIILKEPEDVRNTPEIANIMEAFNKGMKDFEDHNSSKDYWLKVENRNEFSSPDVLLKFKELICTAVASDSAYYLMFENILREYCLIKMSGSFGEQAVKDAFDKQWMERMLWLKEQQKLKEVKQ